MPNSYSPDFREAIIARMLPPGSESMNRIARETGISVTTLRVWKQRALGERSLQTQSGGDRTPSLSYKFQIAFESASLSEEELSAYARARGLQVEQIQGYRRDCLQADALLRDLDSRRRQEVSAMEARLRDLEQEQKARDRTIAELAALVALAKKILCDPGTPRTRGRMISTPDRMRMIELIDEALAAGARPEPACALLHIAVSTYYSWKQLLRQTGSCADRRPQAEHPPPSWLRR